MRNDDKRRIRRLKRDIKQAGNRKRRRHLQRTLREDPEGAAEVRFDYGRDSSESLNGNDRDSTRQHEEEE